MTAPALIELRPIGVIHSPYNADGFCPDQPVEREQGECRIELLPEYADGLTDLDRFSHVWVLFHLGQAGAYRPKVRPPWAGGREVGTFASRSPRRPCPIGMSLVALKRIEGSVLVTGLIDAYDGSAVLDIKPHIPTLDTRPGANHGWIEGLAGFEHLLEHVRGLPHSHEHEHGHDHGQGHDHHHAAEHHHDDDHEHSDDEPRDEPGSGHGSHHHD